MPAARRCRGASSPAARVLWSAPRREGIDVAVGALGAAWPSQGNLSFMSVTQMLAARPSTDLELTILMPCLNEAETLATCIQKALRFLDRSGIRGEVLIADNGSTDGSREIAAELGARVVRVPERGYGAALQGWHPGGRRPLCDHGRRRRQLRLLESEPVRGQVARRRRARDGQPLQRRHRAGRHARIAQVSRQSRPERHRPLVLQGPGRRFPLRAARLRSQSDCDARPRVLGDGVRERDGRQGDVAAEGDRRGADHAVA